MRLRLTFVRTFLVQFHTHLMYTVEAKTNYIQTNIYVPDQSEA